MVIFLPTGKYILLNKKEEDVITIKACDNKNKSLLKWKVLEKKGFEYCKKVFTDAKSIELCGGSNSGISDIKINNKSEEFFVEVKAQTAQCCQFVLQSGDNKSFEFAKSNKMPYFNSCEKIIKSMNKSYEHFNGVNTSGLLVNIDNETLYELVNEYYVNKNVKYFISGDKDLTMFPIDEFSEYFDIKAYFRKKKSGSSSSSKQNIKEIVRGLEIHNINGEIKQHIINNKTKYFLYSDEYINNMKIECDKYTYQFKENKFTDMYSGDKKAYEIRRLSNTSNPTVICQISFKK